MISRSVAFLVVLCCFPDLTGAQVTQRADTVVKLAQRPLHLGVATLVEEVSIGVADGAEEYMLGDIADIALGRDGSIFALDRQVPVVRQYDAQGKFVRNIGRRGQGPGEMRSPSGIALTRDGRLLLWDTANWRINIYSATGDILPQITTPSGSSGSSMAQYARALMVDTAGRIVTRKTVFSAPLAPRPTVWLRFEPNGNPIDTVYAPPSPFTTPELVASNDRFRKTNEVPFWPQRHVAMSPLGHMIAGFPNRYAFEIHRPDGPVISVRRDVKPEPVSRQERADARREIEEGMRQTVPTWTWSGPDIPDTKPYYSGLQVALDGRIWVVLTSEVSPRAGSVSMGGGSGPPSRTRPSVSGPPPKPPRPALYDVFEPDGQYLGQVQVPAKVSSVVRRGDQVWAIAYDDDDVPRIKRYRIAWKG
jgi:hypothetical protein